MEQWPLVLTDSVLLVVALGGAILTLVRIRRVGGQAATLAATACGVLVAAAVFDMIWWVTVVPNALNGDNAISTVATMYKIGTLGVNLLIATGIGLLIVATNVGRSAAPAAAPAQPPAPQPVFPMGTPPAAPVHQIPHQHVPQQQPAQQQGAQPASGWPPPQQPGQPDWNIHSGVWSIHRGTPPDQQQPR